MISSLLIRPLFLSRSFDDFSSFHSSCVCCSHSKRGLQNFDKNYRLSVVVKRHSSQRGGREKKIELYFTHIHFEKEQQQWRRTRRQDWQRWEHATNRFNSSGFVVSLPRFFSARLIRYGDWSFDELPFPKCWSSFTRRVLARNFFFSSASMCVVVLCAFKSNKNSEWGSRVWFFSPSLSFLLFSSSSYSPTAAVIALLFSFFRSLLANISVSFKQVSAHLATTYNCWQVKYARRVLSLLLARWKSSSSFSPLALLKLAFKELDSRKQVDRCICLHTRVNVTKSVMDDHDFMV